MVGSGYAELEDCQAVERIVANLEKMVEYYSNLTTGKHTDPDELSEIGKELIRELVIGK